MPAPVARPALTYRWLSQALSPWVGAAALDAHWPRRPETCQALFQLGSAQLVLPSLHVALRRKGVADALPADFAQALEGFHSLNALHNARLQQQMRDTTRLLNRLGVAPVWLKGATRLLVPPTELPARMMLDLDFWIPAQAQQRAVLEALAQAGYQSADPHEEEDPAAAHHHFAPRFRDGEPARLEIHHHLVRPWARPLLDDRVALPGVEWLDWEGLKIGRLAAPERLKHSYIQCTEMNRENLRRGRIPLMKALDFSERFAEASAEERRAFLAEVQAAPWETSSRRFFSFLERYFGVAAGVAPDHGFLRRVGFELDYPKASYCAYLLGRAGRVLLSGEPGPPRTWGPRLAGYLQTLRQL